MEEQDRIGFIRRGNELYNNGDIKNALKIFLAVDYYDGILRVADHLYYQKKQKLSALKLYKRIGFQKGIEYFAEEAANLVREWLHEEDETVYISRDDIEHSADQKKENKKSSIVKEWSPEVLNKDEMIRKQVQKKNRGAGSDTRR